MALTPYISDKWQILRAVGFVPALCAIWLLSVDRVEYIEKCPECGSGRFVVQTRILSLPVRENVQEHHTLLERAATDLGIPCRHTKVIKEQLWKLQGLCIPVGETMAGTFFMSGDNSWYDEKISARAGQMGTENPKLVEEFRKRALLEHDSEYVSEFWKKLRRGD